MDGSARSEERIKHNREIERRLKSILWKLVMGGHSVNERDFGGQTALDLTAQYLGQDQLPDLPYVETFSDAYHLPPNSASVLAIAKLLLAKKAEVNRENYLGYTPLDISIEYDNFKMIPILLEFGANVNRTINSVYCVQMPLYRAKSANSDKIWS